MTKHFFKLAAILLLGAVGCARITNLSEDVPMASSKYFVSVGGRLPMTRSAGVNTEGTWTLQFTEEDELFVSGNGIDAQSSLYLAGTLHVVPGSISAGGSRARFEGELTVYSKEEVIDSYDEIWIEDPDYEDGGYTVVNYDAPLIVTVYNETGYDLSAYDNPLDACSTVDVQLIPSGNWPAYVVESEVEVRHNLDGAFVESVGDMMENYVHVYGSYNSSAGSIVLDRNDPIFNVTVTGLDPDSEFMVTLCYIEDTDNFDNTYYWEWLGRSDNPISSDSEGEMHFITGAKALSSSESETPVYYFVKLEGVGVDSYIAKIGSKNLEGKIYTITRTAEPLGELD